MNISHESLYNRACACIPGGVNSPVRAFNSVSGTPIYVKSGKGTTLTLMDGRQVTDFCCSWGAMILGHANDAVTEAVYRAAQSGTTFGINTPGEIDLCEKIISHIPFIDRVRLVNSGTEAVMTALRIARGITGRDKIVKFDGCYHGHSDGILVSAGSGVLTAGESGVAVASRGISKQVADDVFVTPYNDLAAVEELFGTHGDQIAAIIVEPIAGNMGCVAPAPGFLERLREISHKHGALLIFDEVINAFRFHCGLYASLCGVTPDLVTMGKVIGGGFPLAAVGGPAKYMDQLAPSGTIYQAGTLSGNPVAVAAGRTVLDLLEQTNPYPEMIRLASEIQTRINQSAQVAGVPLHIARAYDIFTPFTTITPVTNLNQAKQADQKRYAQFFHGMLERGFYIEPSQFEVAFVSAAHTQQDIDAFCHAADDTLRGLHE